MFSGQKHSEVMLFYAMKRTFPVLIVMAIKYARRGIGYRIYILIAFDITVKHPFSVMICC